MQTYGVGTWGTGIFDDDMAAEVADAWNGGIDSGPGEATESVYRELGSWMDDQDDGDVMFLALASLQLDAGALDDIVRRRALDAMTRNIERWQNDATSEDAAERGAVLEGLRQRIARFADPS